MTTLTRNVLVLALLFSPIPAFAQQTTGSVIGRVTDEQGAAVPGATVTATNGETGFSRISTTDAEGLYHLNALPVGVYDLAVELTGFTRVEPKGVVVNIAEVTNLDVTVRVARVAETVTVNGTTALAPTSSSGLGQVVDLVRIQNLPLNGRQFANLAATVPGVGLGFNSDSTKLSQYTPQISGGNGRNLNYVVDGGDNNDDTTGGLLQMFPLEAIQEFNVLTHRFKAEYGRSDGAVLNVVTRSGTNALRGSWFTLFRDDSLNAKTFSEQMANVAKSPYRRYQYGGSVGGPIVENRVFYFGAVERTQQDTKQVVNTLGLFPSADGVYDTPLRDTTLTGKLTATLSAAQYLSVRYGFDRNSQPNGAGLRVTPQSWSTSRNNFNSINVNHNVVLGQTALNELIVQFAAFTNEIPSSAAGAALVFPNGVRAGANPAAPQTTEQQKWQFRDDVTKSIAAIGGHDLKAGVNWIHEPRLFTGTRALFDGQYTFTANAVNAPIRDVSVFGGIADVNIPLDFFGVYAQDDWRPTSRLTFNLGLRWDYVNGVAIDQSKNPNFVIMQNAGRAGRFDTFAGGALSDFGKEPAEDTNNLQPRLGATYDLRGDGRDIVRGGWGIYTDFAYTSASILNAALDAQGGSGLVFNANSPNGIVKADGTFFGVTDPLSSIAAQNTVNRNLPLVQGAVASPRLDQPYTRQANLGWAHQLTANTNVSADYVRVDGRDLNVRLRPNVLIAPGRRALADLGVTPNSLNFRTAISGGESRYDALILAVRRRMSRGLDVNASYTLADSTSNVGPASDELDANLVQDINNPFGPVQDAPNTRTDARHRVTISAVVQALWAISVSPFFMYRSALPTQTTEGIDLNGDGNVNDRTSLSYKFTGVSATGVPSFEENGPCDTVNCSWRAAFSQLNLRVSRAFALPHDVRIEAIAEMFNLFNAKNPFIPLTTTRRSATVPQLSSFMQPTAYAGDFGQPEQRVGQVGFRITF